jgi:uncharacterized protein (DUF433 family)
MPETGNATKVMPMTLTVEPQIVPLTNTPEGVVRVSGTRVPLETVVRAFHEGATAEEIVQDFSSLTLPHVYAVLAYYLANQAEVDAYMAERAAINAAVREAHEQQFNPVGIRARLLARRSRDESVG